MPNAPLTKHFTVGDRRIPIGDTLADADGTAVDLTGCTVAFRMVLCSDDTVKINSASATVDSATDGQVSYAWTADDVNTAGIYAYWWIVTNTATTKVEHFPADGRRRFAHFHATDQN